MWAVKRLLQKTGLALVALLMCLGVVEVFWRAMDPDGAQASALPPYFDRSRYFYIPETEREHPWADGPPGLRVAVIGDSITLGAGVQPYDRYGSRLEALLNLNRDVPPALVSVVAVEGTSTHEQVRLLGQALEEDPDLVILGICANDTEDWSRPEEFRAWRAEAIPRPPPAVVRGSRLLAWAHGKKEALRTARAHVAYYRRLYDPAYSGRIRFDKALARFAETCRASNADLVAVVFPLLSWSLDEEAYPFSFVRDEVLASLHRHGIPAVDLWSAVEGMASIRLEAIPRIDGHPNEIGHRIAAEELYRFLLEEGMIDPAYEGRHQWSKIDYWQAVRTMMEGRARGTIGPEAR